MYQNEQSTAGNAAINAKIAKAFGLQLVSDVPERLARWQVRP